MNIKEKINKAIVEVRREDKEYNHVLLGKKEYEEAMDTFKEEDNRFDDNQRNDIWQITLVEVKLDSFCKAVYITDREEEQKKLFGELTSK
jgi:hypothetical protein